MIRLDSQLVALLREPSEETLLIESIFRSDADREYERDELGRFAATGGGGDVSADLRTEPPRRFTPSEVSSKIDRSIMRLHSTRRSWDEYRGMHPDMMVSDAVEPGYTITERQFVQERAEFTDKLTADEFDAGVFYSDGGDQVMNYALRNDAIGDDPRIAEWIARTDSMIDKSSLPQDTVVSRFVGGAYAKKFIDTVAPGAEFTEAGYTSVGATGPVWSGEVELKITVPAGSRAAPIPTTHPAEKEYLLPRGTRFRVKSVARDVPWRVEFDDGTSNSGTKHHVELEVVSE